MSTNLLAILSDYTVAEVEFLIYYYKDLDMINNTKNLMEFLEFEERIPGAILGNFGDTLESCYKVGQRGSKNKYEKIAQRFHNRYIREADFVSLTKAICTEEPEIASYISKPYGC